MTTAVTTNFQVTQLGTFKTTDVPPNCMEGLSAEEVEAILNLARNGTLWNSMEDFKCAKADAAGKKTKAIGGGTWIVVDPNDPHIIDLGKFAVREHNREAGTKLVFVRVVFGLQSGYFYGLAIEVLDGQILRNCGALIFESAHPQLIPPFRKLLGWVDNLPPIPFSIPPPLK